MHINPIKLLPAIRGGGPLLFRVFGCFLLFGTLLRRYLPFLQLLHWSLLLQVRISVQFKISGGRGGGGGKVGGSLDLGASLEVNPVFLTARNSFRPLPPPPRFKAISSSSSNDLSGWATISISVWTLEYLSNSPSASEMGITYTP